MTIRFLGAALLCLPLAVSAQSSAQRATFESSVTTPTRTVQPRQQTLAPVTVITRDDIERLQARSMRELLRRVPGVSVSSNGGLGKNTSVFLRGAESDQVLLLVNGVRLGSATAGQPAFQDIPVDQIERMEVVRGPRSSLYGSEAIGGVIQIFTREGGGETRPYFSVSAGRYDTYEAHAGLSGGSERSSYNISIGGVKTDGFNSCTGRTPDPVTFAGGAGCFTDEPDDDAYRRVSGSLRTSYLFDSGLQLKGHILQTDGNNEYDGSIANESDTLQQVLGLSGEYQPHKIWDVKLALGRSRDESNDFLDDVFVSQFDTERYTVSLQNDVSITPEHLITLGVDYRDDRIDSTEDFEETSRDDTGVFAQYLGSLGKHQLQLAVRGDDNEQFGTQGTGSATWGWTFLPAYTATVSYGTAFKAPTFNELYFPGFSNPDLDPEESRTIEIGLKGEQNWGHWSLNAYDTRVDDLIAFDVATFAPSNVSEARIRGAEAQVGTQLDKWEFNGSLTWLDAENRSNDANAGNELPRRPEYAAQLDVDRPISWFDLGASVYHAVSTFDDIGNTRKLDAYTLVDLRGEIRATPDWRVQARIANLLGEDYETAAFFNQPGRSLIVTLRYQPE